jgi:hypothetical protein
VDPDIEREILMLVSTREAALELLMQADEQARLRKPWDKAQALMVGTNTAKLPLLRKYII